MGTKKDEVTEFDKQLGMSISKERKKLKKDSDTQQAVANAVGVTLQTYQHWEAGTRKIKAEHLLALAKHFNISVDYLLGNASARSTNPDVQVAMEYTGLSEDVVTHLHSVAADPQKARQLWCLNAFFKEFSKEPYFGEFVATLEKMYTFSFASHLEYMAQLAVGRECRERNQDVSKEDKQQLVLAKLTNIANYYSADKLISEMLSFLISSLKNGKTPEFSTIPINPVEIFSTTLKSCFSDILVDFEDIGHSSAPSKEERKQLQLELPDYYDAIEFLPPIINYPSNKTEVAEDG